MITEPYSEEMEKVVRLFKTNKITTVDAAKRLGLKLRKLGNGAYRSVYIIDNIKNSLPLVVKFPRSTGSYVEYDECVEHSQREIDIIRKITRRASLKALRPFIPEVYYVDYRHGVMLVEYCKRMRDTHNNDKIIDVIIKVAQAVHSSNDWAEDFDLRVHNVGINDNFDIKILDLGLF